MIRTLLVRAGRFFIWREIAGYAFEFFGNSEIAFDGRAFATATALDKRIVFTAPNDGIKVPLCQRKPWAGFNIDRVFRFSKVEALGVLAAVDLDTGDRLWDARRIIWKIASHFTLT